MKNTSPKALVKSQNGNVGIEVVETPETIQVKGVMQIVIPARDEAMFMMHKSMLGLQQQVKDLGSSILYAIDSIDSTDLLYDIQKKVNKRIYQQSIEKAFMKTDEMAQYLSVSKSFLEKNIDVIFHEGVHYTRANDARLLRWNVEAMYQWIREGGNDEDQTLIEKIFA